jgi:WD40 repeat protein
VASGRARRTCAGHEDAVRSITFHPDGRTLASASFDKTVRIWDAETGKAVGDPLELEGTGPNCVVISPDGKALAANTSWDGAQAESNIVLWDWTSRRELAVLRGSAYGILSLAFSPDGKYLASGGGQYGQASEVKLWQIAAGKSIADLKGHRLWVESVRFSPDGKTLATAGGIEGEPGELKLWELRTLAQPAKQP